MSLNPDFSLATDWPLPPEYYKKYARNAEKEEDLSPPPIPSNKNHYVFGALDTTEFPSVNFVNWGASNFVNRGPEEIENNENSLIETELLKLFRMLLKAYIDAITKLIEAPEENMREFIKNIRDVLISIYSLLYQYSQFMIRDAIRINMSKTIDHHVKLTEKLTEICNIVMYKFNDMKKILDSVKKPLKNIDEIKSYLREESQDKTFTRISNFIHSTEETSRSYDSRNVLDNKYNNNIMEVDSHI